MSRELNKSRIGGNTFFPKEERENPPEPLEQQWNDVEEEKSNN